MHSIKITININVKSTQCAFWGNFVTIDLPKNCRWSSYWILKWLLKHATQRQNKYKRSLKIWQKMYKNSSSFAQKSPFTLTGNSSLYSRFISIHLSTMALQWNSNYLLLLFLFLQSAVIKIRRLKNIMRKHPIQNFFMKPQRT